MLPRAQRLTKRGSFTYVYKNGVRRSTKGIALIFVKAKTLKVGFSVPNKVGKAAVRNKLKRRLRAIIRELAPQMLPVQAVISAKAGAEVHDYTVLKDAVTELLVRSGLIR